MVGFLFSVLLFYMFHHHSFHLGENLYIYIFANALLPRTAPVLKACSWAVGAFVFGSFFMHEYCQRKRLLEIRGLKMAAEMIDQKRAERLEQMRIARQKAREEVEGKS